MAVRTSEPWTTPLLRWAGSKRKLLPHLIANVPSDFTRYVEPFAGSACLFFALHPNQAVLGDINPELMQTYEVVRDHPRRVAREVQSIPDTANDYYRMRSISPSSLNPILRAARFVYLNRHCFNGVYRINRKGEFNVPRGTRTGSVPTEKEFYRCSIALRSADIRFGDYRNCLKDTREGDFVYLDPPYASKRRNTFGEYGYDCFEESNLPDLFQLLHRVDESGASFLFSYCSHSSVRSLPDNWHRQRILIRRHVAGFARHRRAVHEILVSNRKMTQLSQTHKQ